MPVVSGSGTTSVWLTDMPMSRREAVSRTCRAELPEPLRHLR